MTFWNFTYGKLASWARRNINRGEGSGCGAEAEIDLGHLQRVAHPWVAGAAQKQHGFRGR
jgi:hypothetical protein